MLMETTVESYYEGECVYRGNGSPDYILHPEGVVRATGQGLSHEYFLKDHLGNTRVVFDSNGAVLQATDYYAFGLEHTPKAKENENRYLFAGKELQDDAIGSVSLNWIDFGARFYDPQIARWHVIDAKAEKYTSSSTYAYALNNPINLIDPNGMEVIEVNGGYKYTGDDAKAAFNVLKSKNLYIALIKDKKVRENTNSELGQKAHGQWNVFGAQDLKEALFLTSFIGDKSVSNMVLDAHSKTLTSKGIIKNIGISLSTTESQYITADDKGNFTGNQSGLVEGFSSLLNKIEDNGTFATNACNLGSGDFGINTLKGLNNLSGNRGISFLLNMHKGNSESYSGDYSMYGLKVGGSLSYSKNASNGWIGSRNGTIFHVNDVFINRETGTPIQLVK